MERCARGGHLGHTRQYDLRIASLEDSSKMDWQKAAARSSACFRRVVERCGESACLQQMPMRLLEFSTVVAIDAGLPFG